jgi:hypothetical protein
VLLVAVLLVVLLLVAVLLQLTAGANGSVLLLLLAAVAAVGLLVARARLVVVGGAAMPIALATTHKHSRGILSVTGIKMHSKALNSHSNSHWQAQVVDLPAAAEMSPTSSAVCLSLNRLPSDAAA